MHLQLSEMESSGRARAQVTSLESKLQNLEDQYALEVQEKNTALRQVTFAWRPQRFYG